MSAQNYYRDHSSRPLSPPTDATDDNDHYNATDAGEQTDEVPERVTSPNRLDTLPSSSRERNHSGFSDTSGYRETYGEEGNNPYGKNYNMTDEESKEALVPEPRGRSSGYQDLGMYFSHFHHLRANLGSFVDYVEANPVSQASVPLMERGEKGKFARWMGNVRQPLEQRIYNKEHGIGRQSRPYIGGSIKAAYGLEKFWMLTRNYGTVYALTLGMLGVLIYELVYNAQQQGNPFSFRVRVFLPVVYSVRGLTADRPSL